MDACMIRRKPSVIALALIAASALLGSQARGDEPAAPSAKSVAASAPSSQPAWSDWPQFLGPRRDGSSPEKGLLRQWPEGGPKVLWTVPVAPGYGTPIVSKGEIFVLGGGSGGRGVSCLDAFTGTPRWEFKYATRKSDKAEAKKMQPSWGYCPRSSAGVNDLYVYTLDEIGEVYCLDRKSGKEVWYRDLDEDFHPNHNDWKGWCASPVLIDKIVVLPAARDVTDPQPVNEGKLVGLDLATGKTQWECTEPLNVKKSGRVGGGVYSTPQRATFAGEDCLVWAGPTGLVAVRASDGKKVWEYVEKKQTGWLNTPQVMGDLIYQGRMLRVDRTLAPFATSVVWESPIPYAAATYATPVRSGDCLYGFFYMQNSPVGDRGALHNVRLSCLDVKTGREVWKKEDLPHGASIMAADGLLIARWKTDLVLIEPSPDGYQEKGKASLSTGGGLGNSGWTMPVLAYGRLYVRGDKGITCLQVAERLPTPQAVAGELGFAVPTPVPAAATTATGAAVTSRPSQKAEGP